MIYTCVFVIWTLDFWLALVKFVGTGFGAKSFRWAAASDATDGIAIRPPDTTRRYHQKSVCVFIIFHSFPAWFLNLVTLVLRNAW